MKSMNQKAEAFGQGPNPRKAGFGGGGPCSDAFAKSITYGSGLWKVALLCLLLPALASAADPVPLHHPTPAEFAKRLPVSVSGENGVVQMLLPIEVYQHARSADLADLRVFNEAGQLLPYALHRPSYRTRIEFREHATALFPIYVESSGARDNLDLQLRTNVDGSLLTINARSAEQPITSRQLASVIVDLGPSDRNELLESLSFNLPEQTHDYRARLAIERSDDLRLWDGVAFGSVDWISAADASRRLIVDRIDLPNGDGRYLKVRWLEGEPIGFASIRARWRSASVPLDPTLEVQLTGAPGKISGDFAYATSPAIAATSIGLDLAEPNSVMPVTIGFYRQMRQPKPELWLMPSIDSTFYRLTHNGRERQSSRIHIAPLSGEEWVVRPLTGGHTAPKLVLSWQPQTLVFNAQGSGFFLAFGADSKVYTRWLGGVAQMAQVAPGFSRDEIEQLERAKAGVLQDTPKTSANTPVEVAAPDSEAAARTRRFALWSVLGFGVLVLGFMTWRLYGQMQAPQQD